MKRPLLWGALILLLIALTFIVLSGPKYKERVLNEKTAKYDITVKYPVFGNDYVDQDIQKFVAENIKNIKSLPPAPTDLPVKYINTLDLSYEKPFVSKERISVVFYAMTYSGGAHPLTGVFTKNYDLVDKKELTLTDLCYKNDESLEELEKLVLKKLMEKLNRPDVDWIRRGIKENKFLTYAIEPDGLAIYFGQYEVAPYSEGIQKIKLTYNELKGIYREKNTRPTEVLIEQHPEYHEVTYYILDEDRNEISITVTHTELNRGGLHLRSHSLAPFKEQLAMVDKMLTRIFKDEKKEDYHALFIGRLWDAFGQDRTLSDRLMDYAETSPLWDQRTGKPVSGYDNNTVRTMLKDGNLYPELKELFKKHGFELEIASVEKVLIDLRYKLPYDCLTWFRLSLIKREVYLEQKMLSPTGERVDMGKYFQEDEAKYLKQADEIIKTSKSYDEAKEKLIELQRVADNSWKGYGPQILDRSLLKLAKKRF